MVLRPRIREIETAHLGVDEMFLRFAGLSLLVLLLPFTAVAQEAKTVEQLDKEVQDLKTQMTTTVENLTALTKSVTENTKATIANKASVDELIVAQKGMQEQLDELINLQQERFVQQQQILESVVQQDSSGADVLRLSANMAKSEDFRQEVRKAVHDSLDETGEVVVANKMAIPQRVEVNRIPYDIPAGDTLTLKVPVGTVTAQLPGQTPTNWTLTAPNYLQKIDIVPNQQTTVTALRPIETMAPVVTYRPIETMAPVTTYRAIETYYIDPAPIYWYGW